MWFITESPNYRSCSVYIELKALGIIGDLFHRVNYMQSAYAIGSGLRGLTNVKAINATVDPQLRKEVQEVIDRSWR